MHSPAPRFRTGLTLLELLVVLAILAITSALVPVALRSSRTTGRSPLDVVLQESRRVAIRRGEELQLRVDADGVWALASRTSTAVLESGRLATASGALEVRIDALGTCRPATERASPADARDFDMLGCRFIATPEPR